MQITIDTKDKNIIQELKDEFHTEDIVVALEKLLHRFKYKHEYKIANDILTSLNEV